MGDVIPLPTTTLSGAEDRIPRTLGRNHRYRRLLAAADLLAAWLTINLVVALIGGTAAVSPFTLAAFPLLVVICKILGLYDRDELVMHKSTLDEAPQLFHVATLFSLLFWISETGYAHHALSPWQVVSLWISLFVTLVIARAAARRLARQITPRERCLLLGDPEVCERARAKLEASRTVKIDVVGEILSKRIGEEAVPLPTLWELAREREAERVIIAPRSSDHGDVLNLVRAVKSIGLNVSLLPRLLEVVGSSVVIDDVEGMRVMGVRRFGLSRSSTFVKRCLDVTVSALVLMAGLPLLAGIALAIKLDSRGPVLFRQRRVGRKGRTFQMIKFRTMVDGAESQQEDLEQFNEASGLFKIADDPRITPVGRVLRHLSLDELPQLLNVVRGEMSLVGPRPLVERDDSQIEGWDRRRLHLTPGMTGPWQVMGSARIPLNEMVKLDYLYVAGWSLWGDVKILLRTASFVLAGRGL